MSTNVVHTYIEELRAFKRALFGLYEQQACKLAKKQALRAGGTTWGYRLAAWDGQAGFEKITGSSIGEDEIKLFYDLCQLVQPTYSYIIGNGFGFSTFCLALAWPAGEVIAIDNWSEGEQGLLARDLALRIIEANNLRNVHIHTGSSPQDTPAALAPLRALHESGRLSLLFIDGLHTNEAARADFLGALDYLDRHSVVLWHDVHAVRETFELCYQMKGNALFDRHFVLRTYGPMGIYYNSQAHPLIDSYLKDSCLIWYDWEKFMEALRNVDYFAQLFALQRSLPWRIASRLQRWTRRLWD